VTNGTLSKLELNGYRLKNKKKLTLLSLLKRQRTTQKLLLKTRLRQWRKKRMISMISSNNTKTIFHHPHLEKIIWPTASQSADKFRITTS